MAFVMDATTFSPVVLIIFGGFTALFASVVFLTQSSVKTALGYSSVAHMGFMLLVCGLGVYPAAMLHLVAHSFYKAHAFLSSGSAIDVVRAAKVPLPKRLGNSLRIAGSILISIAIYLGFATLWGINPYDDLALLATGAIVIMGLTQIIAPTLDSNGSSSALIRVSLLAISVAAAFFTLEGAMDHLLHAQLPTTTQPGLLTTALIIMVLTAYSAAVFIQLIAPARPFSYFWRNMGIHFRNGWYINTLFDRMVNALYVKDVNDNHLVSVTSTPATEELVEDFQTSTLNFQS